MQATPDNASSRRWRPGWWRTLQVAVARVSMRSWLTPAAGAVRAHGHARTGRGTRHRVSSFSPAPGPRLARDGPDAGRQVLRQGAVHAGVVLSNPRRRTPPPRRHRHAGQDVSAGAGREGRWSGPRSRRTALRPEPGWWRRSGTTRPLRRHSPLGHDTPVSRLSPAPLLGLVITDHVPLARVSTRVCSLPPFCW